MQHKRTKIITRVGLQKEKQERSRNKEQNLLKATAWIFIKQRCFQAKFQSSK